MSQSHLISTKGSIPRRFNVNRHLEVLKGEFELMTQEVESLRKEKNEYKAKIEAQAKELHGSIICGRCRKTVTSSPQIIASSQLKTRKAAISAASRLVPQSNSGENPSGSGILRRVDQHQQRMTPRSTRRTTLIQESHSAITLAQPSGSLAMGRPSGPIVAHSRSVSLPSHISEPSVSTVDPDSPEDHNQSIIFNNNAEKELDDVEMMHVLSHGDTIESVKFSRDGKYLAAGCADGKAYIYDAKRGTLTSTLRDLVAENDITTVVCFSHDGKYLATASSDSNIYIWEIKTKYVRNAFKGHTYRVNSLDFSPNGRLLVSSSNDNTVRLWNMRYGAARVLIHGNPYSYCLVSSVFSPDGVYIASSNSDGIVRIWDTRVGQLTRKMTSHMDSVRDIAFMPDGKGLMSGSDDMSLKYWDIGSLCAIRFRARSQTMDHLRRHVSGVEEQTQAERGFLGHTGCIYSLSISPDGRWVASGSHDHTVRMWDTRNAVMHCILNHDGTVYTVDFSPAGGFLASGDGSGAVKIWRYPNTILELVTRGREFTNPIPRD